MLSVIGQVLIEEALRVLCIVELLIHLLIGDIKHSRVAEREFDCPLM